MFSGFIVYFHEVAKLVVMITQTGILKKIESNGNTVSNTLITISYKDINLTG